MSTAATVHESAPARVTGIDPVTGLRWADLRARHARARQLDIELRRHDYDYGFWPLYWDVGHVQIRRSALERLARGLSCPATIAGLKKLTGANGWRDASYRSVAKELVRRGYAIRNRVGRFDVFAPSPYWAKIGQRACAPHRHESARR